MEGLEKLFIDRDYDCTKCINLITIKRRICNQKIVDNNLLNLSLPSNLIDDDLLRFIMAGINMNISIIELNISHNRIGDQGLNKIL